MHSIYGSNYILVFLCVHIVFAIRLTFLLIMLNYAFIILFLACSASDYQCPIHADGYRTCIGGWEVCDGFTDCSHGADEYGCESESKRNN